MHLRFHSQIPIGPFTSQYGHCFGRDEDGAEDGAGEMAPVPAPVPTDKGGGGGELEDGVAAPEPELLHVKSQLVESQWKSEQNVPGHLSLQDAGKLDPALAVQVLVDVSHVCATQPERSHRDATAIRIATAIL